MIAHSFQEQ